MKGTQSERLFRQSASRTFFYTSGSTGEPKGVAQNHRNVLHHIRNYTNSLHISSRDRLVMLASYGFDAAVMDIFGALLNGASLLPFDIRNRDFNELDEWITAEDATIYHSTPTVFRHFVDSLAEQKTFPSLRLVVMGGERVLPKDVELFRSCTGPDCVFINGFGPSECTIALQCLLDAQSASPGNSVPIGYPVDDTEVLLLNAHGDPGQVCGEIALASASLAPGYWRRPELTAAAFLPDADTPGRRIYCTGDLGRLLPNGMIEFLGRRDFQVKIRGYRVECQEIELVLSQHPDVAQAAVLPSQNAGGEQHLIAYVVPRQDRAISSRQVREFAAQLLPAYMVPQAILTLEKMPLTATGKIERLALPAPVSDGRGAASIRPRNATQKMVAEAWSAVLDVESIGVHEDFFQLGGHSLLAMRVVSRLRSACGLDISVRVFFENATVAALAEYIEGVRRTGGKTDGAPLVADREELVL